ncbi:kinase-like protein [Rozella allomycis CSF55]|uniref:non-specific serine/threonine protein kinase n=1 Tax=Rozella allomycis (strain CSF55) TaxID=988480 RepID=A0A4P9YN84_ROZAC|nr:kinase-like protein [Rozella allomycis CSF55]
MEDGIGRLRLASEDFSTFLMIDEQFHTQDEEYFSTDHESTLTSPVHVIFQDHVVGSDKRMVQNDDTIELQLNNEDFVSQKHGKKVGREDFEIHKVIGKGAYGKVYLVRKISPPDAGTFYAMKVLKKASLVYKCKEQTQIEKNILVQLRHPFIVKLYYAFQTDSKVYLILDYVAGGELFTYLDNEKMLSEDIAAFFLAELALALDHLHSFGIIYRDLKPENIVLDRDGHVKLTDFGLSKVTIDGKSTTMCGTVEYMAPEIIKSLPYGPAVDWWSFGILAHDMILGATPFGSNNKKKTMDRICNERLKLPKFVSPDARDLLNKLLKKNPLERLGSLKLNDAKSGFASIKNHRFFRKIDWKKLENLQLTSPITPKIDSTNDTSCFNDAFTSLPPLESPPQGSPISESVDQLFAGFSYVNTSILDNK